MAQTDITIDTIIFDDGEVRGSSKTRYTEVIAERYRAIQALLADVEAAERAGEPPRRRLERIREDAKVHKNKHENEKSHYAGVLLSSPNLSGTLESLKHHNAPPHFYRGDGGDQ